MEYKYSDINEKIIKSAITVHSTLGNGFHEIVYQRALAIEFNLLNIQYKQEYQLPIYYKGIYIAYRRVDFLVEENIPVETKAVIKLDNSNLAQGLNYLEAYNLEVGMLINFGSSSLEWKRLFNKKYNQPKFKQD